MSLSPLGNSSITPPPRNDKTSLQNTKLASYLDESKRQLNTSILDANERVSLKSKNEPMSLLYKTAISAINRELKPDFGEDALQTGYDSGLDVSPEATAERIVSMSTGFFAQYQKQHPEMEEDEQMDRFLEIISGGIDKGFTEAKDVLDGLSVLDGDIASNIDKTYELIQEKLAAFRERFNAQSDEKGEASLEPEE